MPEPRQAYVVDEATIAIGGEWQKTYDFKPDQICIVLHTAPAYGLRLYLSGAKGGSPIPLLSQGPFIVPGVTENQHIRIASIEAVTITATIIAQAGYAPTSLNAPAITKASVVPGVYQTLVDGANIDWDLNGGSAEVTLAGNRTLNNPTNSAAGEMYFLKVIQDAVGNRTLSWGTTYHFEGGVLPTLSYQPGAVDLFEFMADGTNFICQRMTRNVLASFSPLSIPQCKVWLDAGQGLAGLVDGDAIASWTDMSGLGNHATQGVAAARPVLKTGILNGLPVVRFDGANDYLEDAYAIPNPFSMFIVGYPNGAPGTMRMFAASAALNTEYIDANVGNQYQAGSGASAVVGVVATIGLARTLTYKRTAILLSHYNNEALQGTAATAAAAWGTFRIGSYPPPGNYLPGDVAELIIYASDLTDTQRGQVEGYLRGKYEHY